MAAASSANPVPLSASASAALQSLYEPYHQYKTHIYNTLYQETLFVHHHTTELAYNHNIDALREKTIKQQRKLLSYDFRPGCELTAGSTASSSSTTNNDGRGLALTSPPYHLPPLTLLSERLHSIERSNCFDSICMGAQTAQSLHQLFASTVQNLGTHERHARFFPASPLIQSLYYYGAFALTELSHGTDTKSMRTTATYDPMTHSFILNTPDKDGAKWWIGNLGKHANHIVLAAQLIFNGESKGLHWFVIQVRDLETHQPLPGMIIGDVGHKSGWNFLDHGFIMFQYVSIPYESLLNQYQDIERPSREFPKGRYQLATNIRNESQRFTRTLSSLSSGRIGISHNAMIHSRLGLIIAIRYSESRTQFKNPIPSKVKKNGKKELKSTMKDGETRAATTTSATTIVGTADAGDAIGSVPRPLPENPILSYQLQQYRLLLPFSYNLTFSLFTRWLWKEYFQTLEMDEQLQRSNNAATGNDAASSAAAWTDLYSRHSELHAISSGSKPILTWFGRDSLQASREGMGGHGFSSFARLGQLRSEAEPSVTYEGENHVLIQQSAKYVADAWRKVNKNNNGSSTKFSSPFGSLNFLSEYNLQPDSKVEEDFSGESSETIDTFISSPQSLLRALAWRCIYLLSQTSSDMIELLMGGVGVVGGGGMSTFEAWNSTQVGGWQEVSKSYLHHFMLHIALKQIETQLSSVENFEARSCALQVWTISALGLVTSNMETYLEGCYFTGQQGRSLRKVLLRKLSQLYSSDRPRELINLIAPPDWVIWSPLGLKANRSINVKQQQPDATYDNYFHAVRHFQHTYSRAPYWQLLRSPVPIVGQAGGRFGSTPVQRVHVIRKGGQTGGEQGGTEGTKTMIGRAKL